VACRQAEVDRQPRRRRAEGRAGDASRRPQYTTVFGEALVREVRRDRRIVGITAAMNSGTGLNLLQKAEPEHYFDVGIAEQQAVLFAAGLALEGVKPVAAIYSTFLQRAFDQIVHDVCLQRLNVVFAMDRAGLVGDDGPTHHGAFDIPYLRALPNIVLAAPCDEAMLERLLRTALLYDGGPFALRYPRGAAVGVAHGDEPAPVEIGRGELLREGPQGRDPRLRHRGPEGAGGRRPAGRARAGRDGRRCALRQADRRRAGDGAGGRARAARSRSRRASSRAASARRCGRRSTTAGVAVPRMLRVGLPDRYVTHGAPGLLHAEVGYTGRAIAQRIEAAVGQVGSTLAQA
jgi:1-deoxy-D-xylulose-5-phosphate synthase